jgi:SAM-dependent methyltransferase
MYFDVVDLKEFYNQPLGRLLLHQVGKRIGEIWPAISGERLVGIGYATPYLGRYRSGAERIAALMPAAQGVVNWPNNGPSCSALVYESLLPLPDAAFDRVLLVHGLENTNHPPDLLREIWRILAPAGRLLIVAPNRRGLWSRVETTPLGYGRPYSRGQLSELLRECLFVPATWTTALHVPPFSRSWLIRSAPAWERVGTATGSVFAGVLLVEAVKQLYHGIPAGTQRRFVPTLSPVLLPQGSSRAAIAAKHAKTLTF